MFQSVGERLQHLKMHTFLVPRDVHTQENAIITIEFHRTNVHFSFVIRECAFSLEMGCVSPPATAKFLSRKR